jgi:hypothetical protein
MNALTLEQSINQIVPTLPAPIRRFFAQRKLGETAHRLMERYALHIDQGAVLERELMFLLLGIKSPDEFASELYAQLPVSRQIVLDIISDINKEVFVPLREEMQKTSAEVKPPQPKPPQPQRSELRNVLASVTKETKLLEDHEEPHIEIRDKVQGSSSLPTSVPLKPFNLPLTPIPPNLPGVIHHSPLASPKATATPPKPISPVPPPAPIIKEYSSDPYREPVDEK